MHLTNNYLDLLGKSFSEMKCWDLVVELFKRSGVDLPTYTELDDKMYQAVREPIRGDVLAFSLYGRELDHVGIYMGEGRFIHATEGSGVCIEPISHYVRRLKYIYRWKGNIDG